MHILVTFLNEINFAQMLNFDNAILNLIYHISDGVFTVDANFVFYRKCVDMDTRQFEEEYL